MAAMGTVNWRSQKVQIPTTGIVPSHLVTRRIRVAMLTVSHRLEPLADTSGYAARKHSRALCGPFGKWTGDLQLG